MGRQQEEMLGQIVRDLDNELEQDIEQLAGMPYQDFNRRNERLIGEEILRDLSLDVEYARLQELQKEYDELDTRLKLVKNRLDSAKVILEVQIDSKLGSNRSSYYSGSYWSALGNEIKKVRSLWMRSHGHEKILALEKLRSTIQSRVYLSLANRKLSEVVEAIRAEIASILSSTTEAPDKS